MKYKRVIAAIFVLCSEIASGDSSDVAYQKISSLSNLWITSPASYKHLVASNLVEFSKNGINEDDGLYRKWMSDFVAYADESNSRLSNDYLWLYYKTEILHTYSHVLVDLKSTNFWMKIADRIRFVRNRKKDLLDNGLLGRTKTKRTGKIGDVTVGSIDVDGAGSKEALKRYVENQKAYSMLSKIDRLLLELIFVGLKNDKLKGQLSSLEYLSFRSNIIERAKLSQKEESELFKE